MRQAATRDAPVHPKGASVPSEDRLRILFLAAWSVLLGVKLILAVWLPPFADETFYAWEGRHPAWAYSDLPGLTAWLTALGTGIGGTHPLALRLPFLLIGAAIPWLVVRLARHWFDPSHAWQAGLLALVMPLSGVLGLLAVPDVALVFAALLCLDTLARLRRRIDAAALATLVIALAIGALTHYRFVLVLAAAVAGLLVDRDGRRLLRSPAVWAAVALGSLAWLPLLLWNLDHGGAGLRFQFVDRHPWAWHAEGWLWLPTQFLLTTPALFVLLLATLLAAWRRRVDDGATPWGFIAGFATVAVLGYLVMGFFVDSERVSFHWPLTGWLALIVAAPALLQAWPTAGRRAVWGLGLFGLGIGMAFVIAASLPTLRFAQAGVFSYPSQFAGWAEAAAEVRRLAPSPETRIVANHVNLGAQLAFALDRPRIDVLDHRKNHHAGRAEQLRLWGREFTHRSDDAPLLLVVDVQADDLEERLRAYHRLCSIFGALPPPRVLNVDHGFRRFLLFEIRGPARPGCVTPALTYIDTPTEKDVLPPRFEVSGWAFKEGVGLTGVEVTLDDRIVVPAEYGSPRPGVTDYWQISTDPNHPNVGYRAWLHAGDLPPGRHWLSLRVHGGDGSVETLHSLPVTIGR